MRTGVYFTLSARRGRLTRHAAALSQKTHTAFAISELQSGRQHFYGRGLPTTGGAMDDYDEEQPSLTGKKWRDMTDREKLTFLGKLFIALCTFGFVYPNVMSD
jgi:hypothetical protein